MSVYYLQGNIFTSNAPALTCPVNTVGAMGKGLALQFRDKWPAIVPVYQDLLKSGRLDTGKPFAVGLHGVPQDIILFATKQHWMNPSTLEWIDLGLRYMVRQFETGQWKYPAVALPALGCGLGGLDWHDVKSLMDVYLEPVENVRFEVYI